MNLLSAYRSALREFDYQEDQLQIEIIERLQKLADKIIFPIRKNESIWGNEGFLYSVLKRWNKKQLKPVKGLYLWGKVGRGKTFLMDLFYDHLDTPRKKRQHFHRFMHDVHERLNSLDNESDTLTIIANDLAKDIDIICFDEFFVSDIADAMILGTLFTELFNRGVTLVATSNCAPDDLYYGGLQRARFLPAIQAIKQHTELVCLDGKVDYRLRVLEQAEIYHSPLDAKAEENLVEYFHQIAPNKPLGEVILDVNHRKIKARNKADGIAWFDFSEICETERSQDDYIELSREFHTVLISNVSQMDEFNENAARRFIALVDEFYDRQVKLIISAEVPLFELYQGKRLTFEFQRTESRLQEMQSHDYLAKQHLA
ncbi:MAG: cell division protein ZapE [Gammaproteobacteria bacterium]|nr:AFG1 family ATPase [Gammaproteobacteria bacterium]NNC96670.1 cell division protein ZapE [Gammaproteobacteria bacterium]NNM13220.1 cell division protein ZapE [Gammaproteobacteria bacterium]